MKFITGTLFYYIDFWNNRNFVKKTERTEKDFLCKSEKQYIHYIINYIKENVLMKMENLQNLTVSVKKYNDNNNLHNFIYSIFNEYIEQCVF